MKKINKLKSLLSHQNPNGSLEKLFEKAIDLALEQLDPERREVRRQKRLIRKQAGIPHLLPTSAPAVAMAFRPATSQKKAPRHIPQPLRDQIWLRDQGHCQYRDLKTGTLCGSQYCIEVDHKFPFALGGEHSLNNLQLRCRGHNQLRNQLSEVKI